MILGIDASNIRHGGGATHLVELLRAADPSAHGFLRVIIWGGQNILLQVENRSWLEKCHESVLDRNLLCRIWWQFFRLPQLARRVGCNVLFAPGGTPVGAFRPMVTMSRNLLPYEVREQRRYGLSWVRTRCWLLRRIQSAGLKRADGVIFLTRYAQRVVTGATGALRAKVSIIPHGIDDRFICAPRPQHSIEQYSPLKPFRLLYVSVVDLYKHQWNVAEAVSQLRAEGLPVILDLVGPAYGPALRRLQKVLRRVDPTHKVVRYIGAVSHHKLPELYRTADIFVFASSCENLPNILLECMASGLPIACSNRGPMPEVLGDAGLYFDPEVVGSIASTLRKLIASPEHRACKARTAFEKSRKFSWQDCGDATFRMLADIASTSTPR